MTSAITVLSPAFYPNPAHSTRYLRLSAARHNVPIRWYGEGEQYRGWLDVQVTRLLAELETVDTRYVLYADGSDSVMLAGLDEIADKYELYGSPPILMSQEADGLCAGGWMGWTEAAMNALRLINTIDSEESNPQVRWRRVVGRGDVLVVPDYASGILQVVSAKPIVVAGRLWNPNTGSHPCVAHWAGGYSDPEVGKAALIEPTWKELGYESNHS